MSRRKRKTYLGVVALCGVALVADRLIPAAQVTQPAASLAWETAIADSPTVAAPLSIPFLPFPRAIESLDSQSVIRDLFQPPLPPTARTKDPSASDAASEKQRDGLLQKPTGVREFSAAHRLNAVMIQGALRIAVVDKTWVREGQEVDGCTLGRISGNQAAFSCHDGIVTLSSGVDDSSRSGK